MRILFTLHNFYPEQVYGAEKVCIVQMRELLKRGHRVGLFYAGNSRPSEKHLHDIGLGGADLFRVPFLNTKAQALLSAWKPHVSEAFDQTVRKFRPDVIIFHHLVRLSLNLPSVADRYRTPMICYLHDFYLECPLYSFLKHDGAVCSGASAARCSECLVKTGMTQFCWHRYARFILPALRLLTVPCLAIRKRLLASFSDHISLFISPSAFLIHRLKQSGFDLRRSVVIPNGIDAERSDIPLTLHDPVRFGYMGNILKKKGIDVLAKAFRGFPAGHLTIRGFPDHETMRRFKAVYPDLNADLELFDADIGSFFTAVDVVVVPSVWYENQPTVIIEAFQYGKPVICSDIGGMKEMVSGNRGGMMFKTGDPADLRRTAEYLIRNPSEIYRLSAAIPGWLSAEDMTDRLEKAIGSVR